MALKHSEEQQKEEKKDVAESKERAAKQEVTADVSAQVEALVAEQMKQYQNSGMGNDVAAAILKLAEKIGSDNEQPYDKFRATSKVDVAMDDLLETPVIFWAAGSEYIIGGDKRGNMQIAGPYGAIHFKQYASHIRNHGGNEKSIFHVSRHICSSKKELEFLRSHTRYGIRFHEKISDAEKVDVRLAVSMTKHHSALAGMETYRIVELLKEKGLGFTDNVEEARLMLAKVYAEEEMKRWEESEKVTLRENVKEQMLLEKAPRK